MVDLLAKTLSKQLKNYELAVRKSKKKKQNIHGSKQKNSDYIYAFLLGIATSSCALICAIAIIKLVELFTGINYAP